MGASETAPQREPSKARKRGPVWWTLIIIFILVPIPWSPWWLTLASLTVCAVLGWALFGRKGKNLD